MGATYFFALKSIYQVMEPYKALVCNRCVIEGFGGVFVLWHCFINFSLGVGAFVIGLSRISSFFSQYYHLLSYLINSSCKLVRWLDVTLPIFPSLTAPVTAVLSKHFVSWICIISEYSITIIVTQFTFFSSWEVLLGLNEYLTCDSRVFTHLKLDLLW